MYAFQEFVLRADVVDDLDLRRATALSFKSFVKTTSSMYDRFVDRDTETVTRP